MAGIITDLIFRSDCQSFLAEFPKRIGKINIFNCITDGIGLTCKANSSTMLNVVGNVALFLGLNGVTRTKFMQQFNKMIPPLVTKDEPTNAAIILYLIVNGLLLIFDQMSPESGIAGTVKECLNSPLGCIVKIIEALKKLHPRGVKPMTCDINEEYDAGLCYPKCKEGYKGVAEYCWPNCPEGFHDDGAYCRKTDSYDRGVGKVGSKCPTGSESFGGICYQKTCPKDYKRTASCTCESIYALQNYTKADVGIEPLPEGSACNNLNWSKMGANEHINLDKGRGWYKTAHLTCQKGGTFVYTKANVGIEDMPEGSEAVGQLNWSKIDPTHQLYLDKGVGWFKTAHLSVQKGGVVTNCGQFGANKGKTTCQDNEDYDAGLCYPKPKPGYKCTATSCSKICPNGMSDIGVSCQKKAYYRSTGKAIHTCAPGDDKIGLLCYQPCPIDRIPKGIFCYDANQEQWDAYIKEIKTKRDALTKVIQNCESAKTHKNLTETDLTYILHTQGEAQAELDALNKELKSYNL